MTRIASLRFYEYPGLSGAFDAWWSGLAGAFADRGIAEVPESLCREGHPNESLRSPRLLFGQTCGLPLTHELKDHVRPVVTPEYDTPDTDGPMYRSLILARSALDATDLAGLRGTRVAINSLRSFSGYIALQAAFARFRSDRPFFRDVLETSSHHHSLIALSKGGADVCACDCVSYHLIARLDPALTRELTVVGYGPWAPGLPFVTHISEPDDVVDRLREGVLQALATPSLSEARADLMLCGASVLGARDYAPIVELVQKLHKMNARSLFPADCRDAQENGA